MQLPKDARARSTAEQTDDDCHPAHDRQLSGAGREKPSPRADGRGAPARQRTQPGSQLRELRGRPQHGPVAAPAMRPSGGHPAKAARRDSRRRGPPSAAEAAEARRGCGEARQHDDKSTLAGHRGNRKGDPRARPSGLFLSLSVASDAATQTTPSTTASSRCGSSRQLPRQGGPSATGAATKQSGEQTTNWYC